MILGFPLSQSTRNIVLRGSSGSCIDDNGNCRQLFDIVWGCLVTIFASTWVSVHPNVPATGQSRSQLVLRRLSMMLIAILAPELMVFFAGRQFMVARRFSKEFNVSMTHGFFISMGGFVSRVGQHPITTMQQFKGTLGAEYKLAVRTVKVDELADKSTADGLSKTVATSSGTLLEVATLAFAVINLFTWMLWWYKPMDVQYPILIGPFDMSVKVKPRRTETLPALRILLNGDTIRRPTEQPTYPPQRRMVQPAGARPIEHQFSKRQITAARFFWGPIQGEYAYYLPRETTSVPAFWTSPDVPRYSPFGGMLVGIIFGTIHCAAWNAEFPTVVERTLWRACAVFIATYPAGLIFPHLLGEILCPGHVHEHVPTLVKVLGISAYLTVRLALTILSLTTIRTLNPKWFIDVDWTQHLPRFGFSG
ncbi:hypothetical protein C8R43DRAFT_1230919 [Mycena crocata]|nr:hypothetical protein C8R43DRAFT_1230919 [Mycena crocata]